MHMYAQIHIAPVLVNVVHVHVRVHVVVSGSVGGYRGVHFFLIKVDRQLKEAKTRRVSPLRRGRGAQPPERTGILPSL